MPRTMPPAKRRGRRTAPIKKIRPRRTAPIVTGPKGIQNAGGYLLNPPDYCPKKTYFTKNGQRVDDAQWVDFCLCNEKYCELYPCDFKMWWDRALASERNQYYKDNGVIHFIPWQD